MDQIIRHNRLLRAILEAKSWKNQDGRKTQLDCTLQIIEEYITWNTAREKDQQTIEGSRLVSNQPAPELVTYANIFAIVRLAFNRT